MQHDHDDPKDKAFHTTYFQNVYPAASLCDEMKILRDSVSETFIELGELKSPTLTEPRRIKILEDAEELDQKISLVLSDVKSAKVPQRLFNRQMGALRIAIKDMGTDMTEAKLINCAESLGFGVPHNEESHQAPIQPPEPAEAKVLEALQALSLTNTQGSSSASTSSDAKLEKDETDKNGINRSYQP